MQQCLATTKSGSRCKRVATVGCAGYCRQHFDDHPDDGLARAKAKEKLLKAGRVNAKGISIVEFLKEIWDMVEPFLSDRERHYLVKIGQSSNPHVRIASAKALVRSLSMPRAKK